MAVQHFFSHGKLLISGEYVVLDGADAFSVPTRKGQHLHVQQAGGTTGTIHWRALDESGKVWLEVQHLSGSYELRSGSVGDAERLNQLLQFCRLQLPELFSNSHFEVETHLDFPRNWGLGSSSTLISNLSLWTQIDPWELFFTLFDGSGYDVATALEGAPILYKRSFSEGNPVQVNWKRVIWDPPFAEQLWFIHLGVKQDSQIEVANWKNRSKNTVSACIREDFNSISEEFAATKHLREFEFLMRTHEKILSALLHIPRIKERLFPDFSGEVKSLGAWGGDFILATGSSEDMNYFRSKGFSSIFSFEEMIYRPTESK